MKGQFSPIVMILIMAAILIVAGVATGIIKLPTAEAVPGSGGACQFVYAYYPSFLCCGETKAPTEVPMTLQSGFLQPAAKWPCPSSSKYCMVKVLSINQWGTCTGLNWDVVSTTGQMSTPPCNTWTRMGPGDYIESYSLNIKYKVYNDELYSCGLSPCQTNVRSQKCGFIDTSTTYYNQDGSLKVNGIQAPMLGLFYIVPYDQCLSYYPESNRHNIGDTCEQCTNTNDCASKYGMKYTYQGKQYGAVCDGQSIQLFDCLPRGGDVCVEYRVSQQGQQTGECLKWSKQSRCDLSLTVPLAAGMCCPGTSYCGPQAFCDPVTLTCKATAACTSTGGECGTNIMCDFTSKKLKTPTCVAGSCTFTEQTVDCCYDTNCNVGSTCQNYKCYEIPASKNECPAGLCCQGDPRYFDRGCPTANPVCCKSGACAKDAAGCSGSGGGVVCDWLCMLLRTISTFIVCAIIVGVLLVILRILPFTRGIVPSGTLFIAMWLVGSIALTFLIAPVSWALPAQLASIFMGGT